MPNFKPLVAAVLVPILLSVLPALAAVRLGSPLGEHMVLQEGVPVPIWGGGAPGGDTVRVSMAGQSVTATSDWQGRWMVVLAPMKAGGPFQMLIQVGGYGPLIPSSAATVRGGLELNDVVVGEVRTAPLPSGAAVVGAARVQKAENSAGPSAWIRIYKISTAKAGENQAADAGRWIVALPGAASNGSAATCSFARELYARLQVPIGVIETAPGPWRMTAKIKLAGH